MDLSIIVLSYNTKELTMDCLSSISHSNLKINYEVIVVDNGSSDGSVSALNNYRRKSIKFPLHLIMNSGNLGFSKANNQAIRKAKGKYILLLNSDTLVTSESLENLLEFAKENDDAGVIGAKLLNKDKSPQKSALNFPTVRRAIRQYWLGTSHDLDKFSPSGEKPIEVDAVVGAAFLITPIAKTKVGILDERYFFFYEDLDYCRRVKEAGLKTYYLPASKIIHLHGASGKSLAKSDDQWKRLIPSSKIYHGTIKHYVFNFILWSGQKFLGRK